jgi:hypothetical protein
MNRSPAYALVALALALAACGGGESPAPIPDAADDATATDDGAAIDGPAEEGVDGDVPAGDEAVTDDDGGEGLPPDAGCTVDEDCAGKVPGLAACEVARCLSGQCGPRTADDGEPCEDGDLCTTGETCKVGQCQGGKPADCDDHEACTLDTCTPKEGCAHTPITGPCAQDDKCVASGTCAAGKCVKEAVDCDDHEPCTTDGCDPATGCTHVNVLSGACDDGSACTTDTKCVDGVCKGTAIDCDDHNVCTTDTCDPVEGCRHEAQVGAKCDDGKTCTTKDRCDAQGACAGTAVDCDDGDPCTDDPCIEGKGCDHPQNTAPCDDLNDCTSPDACADGQCVGAPHLCDSPPGNECKRDGITMISYSRQGVCQAGGKCEYPSQEVSCTSGCVGGLCAGDPCEGVDCSTPPSQCYAAPGECQQGQCSFALANGKSCDDSNPCTDADTCNGGVCAGVPALCNKPPPDTCADATHVTTHAHQGTCDPAGGCQYEPIVVPCAGGCVDGICLETLDLLQAELDAGGLGGMTAAGWDGACVMPGWAGGATMKNDLWRLDAGFEP